MNDSVMRSASSVKAGAGAEFDALIGESPAMRDTIQRLRRIAQRDTTVVVEGDSGTGKELAALSVHSASSRRHGPFVVIDCRAWSRRCIDDSVFDSADGGTVFLDEISELDMALQPQLLRLVENGRGPHATSSVRRSADFRIIAATAANLEHEAARGAFRADLYYRLAVNCVRLPSLAERAEDIPLLWRHFCKELNSGEEPDYLLDDEAICALMRRPWPGNVRELRNSVERVATFGPEGLDIPLPAFAKKASGTDSVPMTIAGAASAPIPVPTPVPGDSTSFHAAKATLVANFELDFLTRVLEHHGGNITAAATAAGLDRVHFLRLLDRHNLRKRRS